MRNKCVHCGRDIPDTIGRFLCDFCEFERMREEQKMYKKLRYVYNEGCTATLEKIYRLVDEKCDPEYDIFSGKLYQVGYQAALRDIKRCLEEHFGEEVKK